MARLPQPGSDNGTWGNILNDYLNQIHEADGTLKAGVVGAKALGATSANDGQVLVKDSAASGGIRWTTPTGGGGVITKADVGLGNVDNTSDASKPISTATQTALDAKAAASHTHTAAQISDASATGRSVLTAADAAAARAAIGAGTGSSNLAIGTTATTAKAGNYVPTWAEVTGKPTISGSNTGDQTLSISGSNLTISGGNTVALPSGGGGSTPVATTTATGTITLAGDLGGTGAAPTVTRVNGISVTGTPSAGQVLKATSATAASWQADETGGGGGGADWTIRPFSAVSGANGGVVNAVSGDFIFANPTVQAITVNLPAPVANARVRVKRVVNSGNSIIVAAANGGVLDNGETAMSTLNGGYSSSEYVSDGTNWWVF